MYIKHHREQNPEALSECPDYRGVANEIKHSPRNRLPHICKLTSDEAVGLIPCGLEKRPFTPSEESSWACTDLTLKILKEKNWGEYL